MINQGIACSAERNPVTNKDMMNIHDACSSAAELVLRFSRLGMIEEAGTFREHL